MASYTLDDEGERLLTAIAVDLELSNLEALRKALNLLALYRGLKLKGRCMLIEQADGSLAELTLSPDNT